MIQEWRTSSTFVFCPFSRETNLHKTQTSVLNIASSNSQIDKPQRGHPKRAELLDVNINTGVQESFFRRLFTKWSLTSYNKK